MKQLFKTLNCPKCSGFKFKIDYSFINDNSIFKEPLLDEPVLALTCLTCKYVFGVSSILAPKIRDDKK
ncbi:MAG: hypothetical protein PHX34_05825 [Candidatus Shapirobacteria bacterium]|nr:hypothetical protein [Candidatus Shapirobacteria bacterium]